MAALFYKVEKALSLTDAALNPNADGTIPMSVTGLNAAGRMTGYFPSSDGNKLRAFVWDNPSHNFTDINALLAADSSMATCINDDGTVAGIFWEMGSYAQKGFVYFADGTISTFVGPDADGGAILSVTAISAAGSLIGTYEANLGTGGFIVEQPAGGAATIQDLGNLGAAYVWPVALNVYDQVAGTIYSGHVRPQPRKVFFWDGTMSLVDISADLPASNWWATGLNSNGSLIGLYTLPMESGIQHSFFWDGSSAADLGDLGGGAGAGVAVIDEDDSAFGTSLNASGALELFRYSPDHPISVPAMTDLGSVGVYAGDQTFQPISLNILNVQRRTNSLSPGGGSAQTLFDLVGFGTDAGGNTRSLLWKDGAIHSVIDLLPAYLSFTAISSYYGSKVLINSAEQIACAGTNTQGQQMALLLSLDPDTDNDGLPDSWEMQYFGHLGVTPGDSEPSGGGLTNWQAYQQGIDPVGYNGQIPVLSIYGGDAQTGAPNGFVPAPLTVFVTANGQPLANAPVRFSVSTGGGQLKKSSTGSLAQSITVFTDYTGHAKVFFQLPGATLNASHVTAYDVTGRYTTAHPFTESTDGGGGEYGSPFDPTNVRMFLNSDGSMDVTWTSNADPDDPQTIDIQDFDANGVYHTIATAPAGSTHYHIPAP